MSCDQTHWLAALHDGELGLAETLRLEAHRDACSDCRRHWAELTALRTALRRDLPVHRPAPDLRRRVEALLAAEAGTTLPGRAAGTGWWRRLFGRRERPWQLATLLAGAAAAWLLTVQLAAGPPLVVAGRPAAPGLEQALVDSHIRSLMADHLTDVASSDRHTVRPWFAGRLDAAPPAVDLAAQGFPLVGGRLDYIDGHPAAALVYRHGRHVINVFVWSVPEPFLDSSPGPSPATAGPPHLDTRRGYALLHWRQGGLDYWAVSDAAADELETLQHLLAGAAPATP